MREIMESRIAVVGVGGVGGYVGGMLANYYPHVTFVARGARGESIREKGLVLHSDYKGEIIARPEAVVSSAAELGPQDIIFICVKNYSLEEVCAQLKGAVGPGTVVVPVMNGVDPAERTAKALGTGVVVSALIYIVAFANPDFSVTQQGKFASLRIGIPGVAPMTMEDAAAEAQDPRVQEHEAIAYTGSILSGADIDFKASKDIEADIWRKYILNCAYNVSTACYNCSVGGLRADPVKMQEYEALVYEALAVAVKKGVHVSTEDAEGIMYRIREEQAENASSSMKRDMEAGRPAEIETFSGYIVREGQRLGVPMPVSERFYEALKEKEKKMNQDPKTRETAAIILQAMKNRRSIRSYTGESVPKEDLDLIVEAGLTSASGHADYPWDILVVQDLEIVHKLAGARLGAANMLKTAGAAIVLTADEQFSTWVEDCSIVLTNMHLLADALGYGSCWIQVRMRDAAEGGSSEDYVRSVVKVPEGFRVEAILSIGIPDKEKTPDDAARQAKRAGFAAEKVQYH